VTTTVRMVIAELGDETPVRASTDDAGRVLVKVGDVLADDVRLWATPTAWALFVRRLMAVLADEGVEVGPDRKDELMAIERCTWCGGTDAPEWGLTAAEGDRLCRPCTQAYLNQAQQDWAADYFGEEYRDTRPAEWPVTPRRDPLGGRRGGRRGRGGRR
jgi:acyl transferase domain-containing protein